MTTMTLPHATRQVFLTDAGLETWMLSHRGIHLPHFAAFPLVRTAEGRATMRDYFAPLMKRARKEGAGFVLDTCTWRASRDWGRLLGYDLDDLEAINREAVAFAEELRTDLGVGMEVAVSGLIGPRGDGYDRRAGMIAAEAEAYHRFQVDVFARSGADMVSATAMTNAPEAIGIARAAGAAAIPCAMSFTLETDGRLPTGQPLADAIGATDAACPVPPAYYMVDCAHPDHFRSVLVEGGDWIRRIRGVRTNALRLSGAQSDTRVEIDAGDPHGRGAFRGELRTFMPGLNVFASSAGTDRHVMENSRTLRAA